MSPSAYIVFTDLDGTLLDDRTYSYEESLPGLRLLQQQAIPVVFCSAKTRSEQMVYREALGIHDPFIVENGGGILAERGYFASSDGFTRTAHGFDLLEFAQPRSEVRRILAAVRTELDLPLRGYGDLTVEEVARLTGLGLASAARAMAREYDETVVTQLGEVDLQRLREALTQRGVSLTRGARFLSISTANDKGRAVRALVQMFARERRPVCSVGIGDSWNDAPLLAAVDIPLLVQRPGSTWASLPPIPGLHRVEGVGPKGWTRAMRTLVESGFPECG